MVERLAQHGLEAAHLQEKRRLFELTLRAFESLAGQTAEHGWWIPGRLEVFGRHTDYAGGHSLVCAVPYGFALVARARTDGTVRLLDARRSEEFIVTPHGSPSPTGWRSYAYTTVRRLRRNFPGARIGADVVFASDLPSASGMSSSSALLTGVAVALAHLAGLPGRSDWQAALNGPADEAGYFACIENGMRFGPLEGDAGVGTHGGSEDHVAIICGRAGEVSAWRFAPIEPVGSVPLPPSWMFVIAVSGVAARKIGEAKESYNRLSREVRMLLELWNRAGRPHASLREALAADPSAAERMSALVQESGAGLTTTAVERRLRHFVREDARVLAALGAFRAADTNTVGILADASQADAEALLRNQVPETIALARAARQLGAFAASSFGAGFGGSVWALVQRDAAPSFATRWLLDYRTQFPERTGATVLIARPSPPLVGVRS